MFRYQHGKALKPIAPTHDDLIFMGSSATNELSVTVNDNKATIAINGKKIVDFTGQPPDGGSLIGLSFGTLKSDPGPSTVTVKSIQVREVGVASNH